MFILGGLVTIAFGVVLCARPGIGAITLALLFGLFSLIAGIWMLVQGIELRRTGKTLPRHTPPRGKEPRPEPGQADRRPGSLSLSRRGRAEVSMLIVRSRRWLLATAMFRTRGAMALDHVAPRDPSLAANRRSPPPPAEMRVGSVSGIVSIVIDNQQ